MGRIRVIRIKKRRKSKTKNCPSCGKFMKKK